MPVAAVSSPRPDVTAVPATRTTVGLASAGEVLAALGKAQDVAFTAYTLRPGRFSAGLEAAAARGAHVRVVLEAHPYDGGTGELAGANAAMVQELRAHGVDAALHDAGKASLHMKAALIDGVAFLDDRNWPDDGRDTVIRTADRDDVAAVRGAIVGKPGSDAHLWTQKDEATRAEAATIRSAPGHQIAFESESFGFGPVYGALRARAKAGDRVRVLVQSLDLAGSPRAAAALHKLAAAGAEVRAGNSDEKIVVAGDRAWVGSANASAGRPQTIDWGMRTKIPALVKALGTRYEENWQQGRPFA
jgi:phosphatidylserine/phosphatidylglycerophosphate/cardiolipin synthase-like enzyme